MKLKSVAPPPTKKKEHEITLLVLDRLWLLAPKWRDVSVKFYLSVRFVKPVPINFSFYLKFVRLQHQLALEYFFFFFFHLCLDTDFSD